MKIELKNIKFAEFASEETNCYSASLYVDGLRIGEVGNDGHGGCDYFHPAGKGGEDFSAMRAIYDKADAWCQENLPATRFGELEVKETLENHCNSLLERKLNGDRLKKLMRGKVVFLDPADGAVKMIGFRNTRKIDDRHIAHVKQDLEPKATILNELPFDQALDVFTANA